MILGAVLAGGASSRFGSDKAAALLGGVTLLDRARATLARVCDEVVVVGRGEVRDRPAPGLGPLGGIAGALGHAEASGFASVLTIACDMPGVPDALIDALLRRAPAYSADAPVLGHWSAGLAGDLSERLVWVGPSPRPFAGVHPGLYSSVGESGRRWMPGQARHDEVKIQKTGALSVRRWAESIGAIPIASPAPLANVNTPADLAAL